MTTLPPQLEGTYIDEEGFTLFVYHERYPQKRKLTWNKKHLP
jgi:hypothetical protein